MSDKTPKKPRKPMTKEEKDAFVPWWKRDKYRYHTSDPVTGERVRPGMKCVQMDCKHPDESVLVETYKDLKAWANGGVALCPICRTPIPDQ